MNNKYNAKTETQLKFAQRVEQELGYVCNFEFYDITRGRGWSAKDGSFSASVALRYNNNPYGVFMHLLHPLRAYLVKKKKLHCLEMDELNVLLEIE